MPIYKGKARIAERNGKSVKLVQFELQAASSDELHALLADKYKCRIEDVKGWTARRVWNKE